MQNIAGHSTCQMLQRLQLQQNLSVNLLLSLIQLLNTTRCNCYLHYNHRTVFI